ncbi:MAG: hypothetical protein IKR48_03155 [Kiritimatiellae bacterium]|nr:hypothetical protein [Kiritimatiellia bacterium]
MCWYVDYRLSLAPRLLFSIGFEDAKHFCPDLVAWRDGANPWEFVPNDIARSLCDHENIAERNVVATYRMRIVGFEPYSFHAVKGDIKIEHSQEDKVYVYSYAARYAPTYEGP